MPYLPPFEPALKILETARLMIRIDTEEEYTRAFSMLDDAELKVRFGLTDEALELQKAKVEGGFSTYRTRVLFFNLWERSLHKAIGSFAYHNWYPEHRRAEIGYAVAADEYMGQGYMKEALPPIISFGFGEMSLNRMEAFIHPDNIPSRKLVKRFGFKQEGWLKEHYCKDGVAGDSLVYRLLHKDYLE